MKKIDNIGGLKLPHTKFRIKYGGGSKSNMFINDFYCLQLVPSGQALKVFLIIVSLIIFDKFPIDFSVYCLYRSIISWV